jgi:hypothetical protein
MYTKTDSEPKVLRWYTNWTEFENTNKTLDEMQADLDSIDGKLSDIVPKELRTNIVKYVDRKNQLLKIEGNG